MLGRLMHVMHAMYSKGPLANNVTTPLPTTRDTTIKLLIEGPGT
jgi:hypothetical protein